MSTELTAEDQARLEDLFAHASGLPARQQVAFATRACGTNLRLCAALLRLLAAHAGADHLQRLRGDGADPPRRDGGAPAAGEPPPEHEGSP